MQVRIRLGGVLFLFLSERDMEIGEELQSFVVTQEEKEEIAIRVSWDWKSVSLPETEPLGEDLICRYYADGDKYYCIARGNLKGPIACTEYTADFTGVLCTINGGPFLHPIRKLDSVLRMLPIREIFQHFGVLFFHAAQISHSRKGILFSAPSGTGKTTQAKLWKKYGGAEIVCNDRTLLRKKNGIWYTYGYPLDGSEPVCSAEVNMLGCIVLLEQRNGNCVQRLSASKSIPKLIEQLVLDCWSPKARAAAMELLLELVSSVPVFRFGCTPDECAVRALKNALEDEGVIFRDEKGGNY